MTLYELLLQFKGWSGTRLIYVSRSSLFAVSIVRQERFCRSRLDLRDNVRKLHNLLIPGQGHVISTMRAGVKFGKTEVHVGDSDKTAALRARINLVFSRLQPFFHEQSLLLILQLAWLKVSADVQFPFGTMNEIVEQIEEADPDIVCISALPPFAFNHARALI
jgi:hypothetical protein